MTQVPPEHIAALYEKAKTHYREACYNVQRTKTVDGPGEAYARAVGLAHEAFSILNSVTLMLPEKGEETAKFVASTYEPR